MPQPQVNVDVDVEAARRLGVEQRAMSSDLIPVPRHDLLDRLAAVGLIVTEAPT